MRRMILVPLLITVALLAIVGGIGYWLWDNHMYYRTDDALISGNIVSVSSPSNGQLSALNIKQGDKVNAGQTLATVTTPNTATGTSNKVNVTSPISGTILQTTVVQQQNVNTGLAIAQVTDLNALKVTAYINENAIDSIKVGQDVDIHVDAYSDTTYTGKVEQIIPAAASSFSLLPTQDNASGNFTKVGQRIPVVISLSGNGGKTLAPGMSAEVTIHIN